MRLDLGHDLVMSRTALVTCSTGVLASGSLVFAPDLDERHHAAIASLPMGSLVRGVALPEDELAAEPNTTVQFVDEMGVGRIDLRPSGLNLATFTLAPTGPATPAAVAEDMAALVGPATGNAEPERVDMVDWATEQWIRGCWSVAAPGRVAARKDLSEPAGEKVWFAGEATSLRSHGTAHGAMLSGEEALHRIACHLGLITDLPPVSDTDDIFRFDY